MVRGLIGRILVCRIIRDGHVHARISLKNPGSLGKSCSDVTESCRMQAPSLSHAATDDIMTEAMGLGAEVRQKCADTSRDERRWSDGRC